MGAVALFGGSFDPVHLGHVNAVKSLLSCRGDIERVMIMPAYVNPFKQGRKCASPMQRLEMCRIAFGGIPRCRVDSFEAERETPSYTVVTLEYLRRKFPESELILMMGSDSLESLTGWHRAGDILSMALIAAAARSGEDMAKISRYADIIRDMGGRVMVVPTKPLEISSTEIREKILKNEDLSCYMDKNVVKYITDNKIYSGHEI